MRGGQSHGDDRDCEVVLGPQVGSAGTGVVFSRQAETHFSCRVGGFVVKGYGGPYLVKNVSKGIGIETAFLFQEPIELRRVHAQFVCHSFVVGKTFSFPNAVDECFPDIVGESHVSSFE